MYIYSYNAIRKVNKQQKEREIRQIDRDVEKRLIRSTSVDVEDSQTEISKLSNNLFTDLEEAFLFF